jgi:hypothetical protein
MVEVYKTNVQFEHQALVVIDFLSGHFPMFRLNFDLEDCDRVLRVEGNNFAPGIFMRGVELIINIQYTVWFTCPTVFF